jgi:pyruvate dehydrogenase E2 component (dihydrolipoamide acetyltransferase)
MTMTEGMVSEWFIADGAKVKKGEMLYSLETEKVNLDVDAEMDGYVKHTAEAGVMLAPGDVVGYIFADDEPIPADFAGVASPAAAPVVEAPKAAAPAAAVSATPEPVAVVSGDGRLKSSPAARRLASEIGVAIAGLTGSGPGGRIVEADVRQASLQSGASTGSERQENVETKVNASPLARRLAAERGIDLSQIKGSGPQGRIVQGDLDQAPLTSGRAAPVQAGPTAGSTVPVRGMRKTIAQRMHQSLQTSAQLSMDMTAQMDDAVRLRGQLIKEWDGEARPTYTDLVIKAVAKALGQHPMMNSRFDDTEITLLREIHMGLAVSVPEGLLVPVIRNVHELNLKQIAQESARLAAAARAGTLGLDDYAGGTFTISALGMFGVNSFTPIINQPQTGILGVNQLFDGLTWDEDKPIKTKQMNLSLTWDHRAVDGAPAAEFLASVVEFLSEPYRLLL